MDDEMKFIFKCIEAEKKKELTFISKIDEDGDFAIQVSKNGEEWWDLCLVDCEDGTLVLYPFVPQRLGLQLDSLGQIVIK